MAADIDTHRLSFHCLPDEMARVAREIQHRTAQRNAQKGIASKPNPFMAKLDLTNMPFPELLKLLAAMANDAVEKNERHRVRQQEYHTRRRRDSDDSDTYEPVSAPKRPKTVQKRKVPTFTVTKQTDDESSEISGTLTDIKNGIGSWLESGNWSDDASIEESLGECRTFASVKKWWTNFVTNHEVDFELVFGGRK